MPLKTYTYLTHTPFDTVVTLRVGDYLVAEYDVDRQHIAIYDFDYLVYLVPVLVDLDCLNRACVNEDIEVSKFMSILDGRGWTKC